MFLLSTILPCFVRNSGVARLCIRYRSLAYVMQKNILDAERTEPDFLNVFSVIPHSRGNTQVGLRAPVQKGGVSLLSSRPLPGSFSLLLPREGRRPTEVRSEDLRDEVSGLFLALWFLGRLAVCWEQSCAASGPRQRVWDRGEVLSHHPSRNWF